MSVLIRTLAVASIAAAAFELSACAATRLSERAASMPVFATEQSHPAVVQAMGPVKTDVCEWSQNRTSIVDDALNNLRNNADAKGATALINYRYEFKTNSPRVQQCRRYIEAEAVAVVLGNGKGAAG